jgi:AraC-like DNA-binding protein
MDTISAILDAFHLNASVFERARFCGHWTLDHAGGEQASFHLVTDGRCWLDRLDGGEPTALDAGDLLVMPRDAPHRLGPERRMGPTRQPERRGLAEAGDGPGLVCGYFGFDEGPRNPVLDALPDYLLLRARETAENRSLHTLIDLIVVEAGRSAVGGDALINRLSDALFIEVVRHYLATAEAPRGLFAALADPVVGRALRCLHAEPASAWTVEGLARAAASSRSALTERFTATLGTGPITYLFQWRMELARRWLRDGLTVAQVAERCGYATEPGFSKAFRRHFGVSAGRVRRAG